MLHPREDVCHPCLVSFAGGLTLIFVGLVPRLDRHCGWDVTFSPCFLFDVLHIFSCSLRDSVDANCSCLHMRLVTIGLTYVSGICYCNGRINYIYLFEIDPRAVSSPLEVFNNVAAETIIYLANLLIYYKVTPRSPCCGSAMPFSVPQSPSGKRMLSAPR